MEGDKDEDKERTTTTSFFITTTNLWSDAFLAGRGGDFEIDDNNNN